MIRESFQIKGVQITGKYICETLPPPPQHDLIISLLQQVYPKNEKCSLKKSSPPNTHAGEAVCKLIFLKIYKI